MQTMSYFHLNQTSQGVPSWKGNPLTSMPPWVVRYAGENSGIVGIMCLGEQPPAAMLKEAINGTLVAVVVIDDMSAIAGSTDDNNGQDDLSGADGSLSQGKRQIIVNTPEDLPYLNPDLATPPDPKHSHSLGVALVRGIDTASKTLHLLTPISAKVLREMSHYGKSMVLVSGKLETPGWAYTEELYRQAAAAQSVRNKALEEHVGDERGGAEEEEEVEVEVKGWEDAPWIERVEGHQGRGVGARVWKVRRDLGRGGDGV
jgi:polynucleotide 5'-hydroxyl-kinase GRC3/NOL9